MEWYISDYGVSSSDLAKRYSRTEQHPGYTCERWRADVAKGHTLLGYWHWVRAQLMHEQDELERDNPYTQYGGPP